MMTAQEWLDELERLGDAATPGPWINPGRAYVAQQHGAEKVIANCKSNEFGQAVKDTAYIVAACNAVPRLVEMLRIAVSLIEAQNAQRARKGEKMPEGDVMQLIFTLTEPKE